MMPDTTKPQAEERHVGAHLLQTLGARIFASHLLAIGLAIALVSFSLLTLFRTYFIDALEKSLLIQADLITHSFLPGADPISVDPTLPSAFNTLQQQQVDQLSVQIQNQAVEANPDSISEALETLRNANVAVTAAIQTDVFIFDRDLEILLSPVNPALESPRFAPLVSEALEGQVSREIMSSSNSRRLAIASPLRVDDEVIAAVVLSHPLQDLEAVFFNLWIRVGLSALFSLLLTGLISLFFTRNIQNPVQELRTASEKLQNGIFDYPLPADRPDELGDLSRAFEMMRTRLKATERARTQFLSDIAHELRTPLTSIKSLTETLQDGAVEDRDVRDRFLGSIEHETDRLIRLTQDLMILTRADVGEFSLRKADVDLRKLIAELLAQFEIEAERKSIRFQTHFLSEIDTLEIDRDRIRQVMVNLLDNALRYAPEGSVITLDIETAIYVSLPGKCKELLSPSTAPLEPTWQGVLISVADDGPGVPEEDQARIFDRFYRVDRARDRVRGGSGLGLPIAKTIVEAHGGCIWMESPRPRDALKPGPAGTAVKFFLPHNTSQSN